MAIRRGRVEVFHDDQLVVALPDLDTVAQTLMRLGVGVGSIERSAALGLALLRDLTNVTGAVRMLRQDSDIGPRLARPPDQAPDHGPADLDLLIKGIEFRFARRFPGWKVELGKNYRPSYVKGYPHVGGTAEGDPEPADPALARPGPGENPKHGHGVRVGLLDTRIFPDPWLTGRYIARHDAILDPEQGHFTVFDGHCAFISSCILRYAPSAEIHLHPVLDSDGDGSAWNAAIGMAEMARIGVDVVNLSFGEIRTDDDSVPMVLQAAVKRFSPDTVVVAAAGNNGAVSHLPTGLAPDGLGPNSASYPAALTDVVGVGALAPDGSRAAFTPHPAPWIALLAPGVGLTGAYVDGLVTIEHKDKEGRVLDGKPVRFRGAAKWEGCSFAAGVVSGAIAAGTVPGCRSARQALDDLLDPDRARSSRPGSIRPNDLDNAER